MDQETVAFIYLMEYYSAIKNHEDFAICDTWIGPKGILLSETSQTGKDEYPMISLMWNTKNKQNTPK